MLVENKTIARPYATALYALAQENNTLPEWSQVLAVLASISQNDVITQLLGAPHITATQWVELLADLVITAFPIKHPSSLQQSIVNFITLLVQEKRLMALPDIHALYQNLLAQKEGIVHAQLASSKALTTEQRQNIQQVLEKRFAAKVTLSVDIDESLMGGALIRAGNWIIDGSVRDKLSRLAECLA